MSHSRVTSWAFRLLLSAGFALGACTDDDAPAKLDAGATEHDAGFDPIPRLDAGEDVIVSCDRFDEAACGGGQVCNELIREQADGTVVAYAGCVVAEHLRGLGDPCTPWLDAYETAGLLDRVYLDPCGAGTICANDPHARGATSCQPACQSGVFGDGPQRCRSSSAYCFGPGGYQEVCVESDGCDPAAQTGCSGGKACYLQLGDDGRSVLSVCLTPSEMPVVDQQPCSYVNDCVAGSSCFGPAGLAPAQWGQGDFVCRPVCTGAGVADAGTDDAGADDAGVATACTCEPYSTSSLDFSEIPSSPHGQCEL